MRPPAALALTIGGAASAAPATLTARPAQEWRDSVAINTHLNFAGTPEANYQKVEEKLAELGVDNIRDGMTFYEPTLQEFERLGGMGIRGTLISGRLQDCANPLLSLPTNLDRIRNRPALRAFVRALEGPNESDYFEPWARCGGQTTWADSLRWWTRQLWEQTRDAVFAGVMILAPSYISNQAAATIGNVGAWVDGGNIHPYPSDGLPGAQTASDITNVGGVQAPGKPCWATETGYHIDTLISGGNEGVPPTVRAAYNLRLLLESRRLGVPQTALYTLLAGDGGTIDGQYQSGDWGFYNYDWTPRQPMVTAMSAFQHTIGKGGTGGEVEFKWTAKPADVHYFAFRRADGAAVLAVWRNAELYDRITNQIKTVTPVAVRWSSPLTATVVRPVESATETPAAGETQVAGDPVLVVLR